MPENQDSKSRVKVKPLPPVEYLRECFSYDPETGMLIWKRRPREHFVISEREWIIWNKRFAGKTAGTNSNGYCRIYLDSSSYAAQRIVWKWVTGEEPLKTIDHDDGNKANNRWINLRPATMLEQSYNVGRRKHNRSGYRGVRLTSSGTWHARIVIKGVKKHLGAFATPEEASAVYEAAAREYHGEFYREINNTKEDKKIET